MVRTKFLFRLVGGREGAEAKETQPGVGWGGQKNPQKKSNKGRQGCLPLRKGLLTALGSHGLNGAKTILCLTSHTPSPPHLLPTFLNL